MALLLTPTPIANVGSNARNFYSVEIRVGTWQAHRGKPQKQARSTPTDIYRTFVPVMKSLRRITAQKA
jgi:hypothetical protein